MGKSKNNITNWPAYNHALTQHGSITFWVDELAIEAWTCTKHHGKRGRWIQQGFVAALDKSSIRQCWQGRLLF